MKKIALLFGMLLITATMFAQNKQLPTWKTITLGVETKTSDGVFEELKEKGITFVFGGGPVQAIIGLTNFSVTPQKLDLVMVSYDQLNLTDDYSDYNEIVTAAKALGLSVCPAEVGPILRLQYLDQSTEENLIIGMKPIYYQEFKSYYVYSLANTTCGNVDHKMSKILKLYDAPMFRCSHDAMFVFCRSSVQ